ncbi:unnamed protein product [Euphydryas editha]|uniref:Uncharacterized protein n=1 Tax=Euphydryas editha TaxID=104508 RepID=A0AAU9V5B4_EUPED|nr:unnamed protein product [Euphydryas editha]
MEALAEVYRRVSAAWTGGTNPPPIKFTAWWDDTRRTTFTRWKARLETSRVGLWAIGALQPISEEWTVRQYSSLSGHGCFGKYLHVVARRETTPDCHHSDCCEDSAQHTRDTSVSCPAWAEQRRDLAAVIGEDLSPPAVARALVGGNRAWTAVAIFCENVISQKEAAERARKDLLFSDHADAAAFTLCFFTRVHPCVIVLTLEYYIEIGTGE